MKARLRRLRRKARRLYLKANNFDDLDCGRHLAEYIYPDIHRAKERFNEVYSKIQKLDPNVPPNPFQEATK